MGNDVIEGLHDWLTPVHTFSESERARLGELQEAIILEARKKNEELPTKVLNCWTDILKIVAVHVAMQSDTSIPAGDLRKWLVELKDCLERLVKLFRENPLSKNGLWLLELYHAAREHEAKIDAERLALRLPLTNFIAMYCNWADMLIGLVDWTLTTMPTKGGRPPKIDRQLLSDGVVSVLYREGIEISSSDESFAVYVVDQIYRTFSVGAVDKGSSKHNVAETKKKIGI